MRQMLLYETHCDCTTMLDPAKMARPEGFEPPTLWFEVRFPVFWLSQDVHIPQFDTNLSSL